MRGWRTAANRFRYRRMRQFVEELDISERTRVLDVGGTPHNWLLLARIPRVTLVNMPRASEPLPPNFDWVSADGCALPFGDQSFDVVFSNSVIEHIGSPERQRSFANEVRRVGCRYWVQTPDWWTPIEPHLLMPAVHWLPHRVQQQIVSRWTVWQMLEHPSEDRREFYIRHYLDDIRLLDAHQMRALFPEARLIRERVIGINKSLVAVK